MDHGPALNVAVLYAGSSLPGALRRAEREINTKYGLGLRIARHNCTAPLGDAEWEGVERDLAAASIVFAIHVTDAENATRLSAALDRFRMREQTVIAINCMGHLMRRTRFGNRELFSGSQRAAEGNPVQAMLRKLGSWMGRTGRGGRPEQYLRFLDQVPTVLRFVPAAGRLGDIKHYLTLFCYFMQPTPGNVRSMILYAIRHCTNAGDRRIRTDPPQSLPVRGIYHPDAPSICESFEAYRTWYEAAKSPLDPAKTVGLLLLRPQVVSGARGHYDFLIRAIESEGMPTIPALSTFMDNRDACRAFFTLEGSPLVSQVLSLTGFGFVGGPAMNDSAAAAAYLRELNVPFRSAVSLETQRIENWAGSAIGLNAVQAAMQVAIPEIDGATEPFVYGGTPHGGDEPEPLEDRCLRIAGRLARWSRLQRLPRSQVRLAMLIYCFPPNKGNLGTAADLDVFPSVWAVLRRLQTEGYAVAVPENADALRELLLEGDEDQPARIAYRLGVDEYYRLCPYVEDIEAEWGPAPGTINARGRDILIHGLELGNVFLGVQPTFGYEGDPMRMLMAKGGAPHHGFMGLYVYLEHVFHADALVHVGTHGALEFMPGKQVGLSSRCWPDRLIGLFPNVYIYSVNNPSEGSIAKRRSYAELISYLTPPVEDAGLYKELASLKELLAAYRQARDEKQREYLFGAIEEKAKALNLTANMGGTYAEAGEGRLDPAARSRVGLH